MLCLLCVCASAEADGQGRELRAFWADGFNEGYKTPEQIDTLLRRLHDARCNAIFAQMRKGGDAYYISHYEPWASDDTSHFDALACLIEKAHRMQPRIAVHAWINTCAVGTGKKHPNTHVAQLHPEWMSVNARGQADDGEVRKIDPGNPDGADWTFRLYLDVVRHYDVDGIHFDFVRYGGSRMGYNPVSVSRFLSQLRPGIHPKPYTPHPSSPSRSQPIEGETAADVAAADNMAAALSANAMLPAPTDPLWKQWRRDQVTNLVRKVYAHAVQLKPQIVVSAATIAWGDGPHNRQEWDRKSAAMNRVFQDWRGWLQEGILDLACPMTYFGGKHGLAYEQTWSAWIKAHQYERAAAVAVGNWQLTPAQTLAQMQIARAPDKAVRYPYGVMLYSYAGTNLGVRPGKTGLHELELQPAFYAMLSQPVPDMNKGRPPFVGDAVPPSMAWKEQAAHGILKGFVRDARLQPLDDALVTVQADGSSKRYTKRTDGTGFYAFVELPPGNYAVTVAAKDSAPASIKPQQAHLEAGKTTTCHAWADDSRLSREARVEILDSLQAVVARAATSAGQTPGAVRVTEAVVVLGTDTFPGNLYVRDMSGTCLRVRLNAPSMIPFQPGDIVALVGTPSVVEGEPALDHAIACLNDIRLQADLGPTPLPLRSLASGAGIGHSVVRIRGVVTQSNANGFTLSEDKAKLYVPLAGRKNFGVEDGGLLAAPFTLGSTVEVTGLTTSVSGQTNQPTSVRLLPRTSADLVLMSPPPKQAKWPFAAIGAIFALLAAVAWAVRRTLIGKRSRV